MKYRVFTTLLFFCSFVFLAALNYAEAQNFNIDFTSNIGTPLNTFGAASGQTGVWNTLGLGATSNLLDIAGTSTPVGATVTAPNSGSDGLNFCPPGDIQSLLSDQFHVNNGATWSFGLTGLTNGDYTVYIYGPRNNLVPTGSMTVNGAPVSSVTGDSCIFTEGTTHRTVQVSVTTGTLDISGSQPGTYAGLSGIQLIQRESNPTAVPTMNEWGMIIIVVLTGLGAVYYMRRQRRVKN